MLKITPSAKAPETKLTFSLPIDHPAGQVSVVGNFNDWTPGRHRMLKRNNGTMSVSVTVPADYISNFRYLGENGEWFDEPDADRIDSGASTVWPREAPAPVKAARTVSEKVESVSGKVEAVAGSVSEVVSEKVEAVAGSVSEVVSDAVDTVARKVTRRRKA